ncbi:MAG: hypothetical protein DMF61_05390 [Blastocatellia bacterium AA13]|nr:MAG: hypothetical protein DMF61_05390 [Blastocatellia bacterium AA13]
MINRNYRRLRFDRVQLVSDTDGVSLVEVSFTFAGSEIKTTERARGEGDGPLRAAARATLLAIEQAVEGRFSCALADLDRVNALGKDLIAVLVNLDYKGSHVQLFGSCQIAGSEIDVAVKAALNATNRFVELALRD